MIPNVLKNIVVYLKECKLELVSGSDARINSANSESKIISALQNTTKNDWKVLSPNVANNRCWYDFSCIDTNNPNQTFYCDIKISNLTSNDNMNCKKAIYWLLTGDVDTAKVPEQNKTFFENLKNNEDLSENRDFYYLIINKTNTRDIFIVSLKNINSNAIKCSHNNPPFQANWHKCRQPEHRSIVQAKDFLLSNWAKTIKKHMQTLQKGMPNYYPEYFKAI